MVLHCLQQYAIGVHEKSFLSILKNVNSQMDTLEYHELLSSMASTIKS